MAHAILRSEGKVSPFRIVNKGETDAARRVLRLDSAFRNANDLLEL